MICIPCRQRDHANCDNRVTNIERDEIVLNGTEVTKTRCACQHSTDSNMVRTVSGARFEYPAGYLPELEKSGTLTVEVPKR